MRFDLTLKNSINSAVINSVWNVQGYATLLKGS